MVVRKHGIVATLCVGVLAIAGVVSPEELVRVAPAAEVEHCPEKPRSAQELAACAWRASSDGDRKLAKELWERSLDAAEYEGNAETILFVVQSHAQAAIAAKDYEVAAELLSREVLLQRAHPGISLRSTASSLGDLAFVLDKLGRYAEAETRWNELIEEQSAAGRSAEVGIALVRLGHHYHLRGDRRSSQEAFQRGLAIANPLDAWVVTYLPEIFPHDQKSGLIGGDTIVSGLDSGDDGKIAEALSGYAKRMEVVGLDEKAAYLRVRASEVRQQ